ncbi:MAG TPA: hypothetical protein ENK19_12355 [Acidobacteria bacterium]|nr:hypothetical protein [Acidobacteriota bacterium]
MTESISRPGVVLRFRDGKVVRGRLADPFEPGDRAVEAVTEDGNRLSVSLDELKAIFFLKDPKKRRYEMEFGVTEEKHLGAPARVVFQDGEIMHGQIETYSMADGGFFIYPANRDSNNEKVFVIAGALTSLAIEG